MQVGADGQLAEGLLAEIGPEVQLAEGLLAEIGPEVQLAEVLMLSGSQSENGGWLRRRVTSHGAHCPQRLTLQHGAASEAAAAAAAVEEGGSFALEMFP